MRVPPPPLMPRPGLELPTAHNDDSKNTFVFIDKRKRSSGEEKENKKILLRSMPLNNVSQKETIKKNSSSLFESLPNIVVSLQDMAKMLKKASTYLYFLITYEL